MMYQIKFTSAYKKSYRLLIKRGFDITLLDEVIEKLANGHPLEPKYKNHVLRGKFNGICECHIKPNWLLLYKIEDDILILTIINSGNHSDIFNL